MKNIEDCKKPELSGMVVKSALLYLEDRLGRGVADAFLESHGITREYLKDPNNWISFAFAHELLALLRERIDAEKACWEAGTYTVKPESLGRIVWIALKSVGTPSLVFKQVVEYSKTYNRVGSFRLGQVKKNQLVLEYRTKDMFRERDDLFCQYRIGQFSAIPTLWGLPLAHCKKTQCLAKGDPSCTYEFTWQNKRSTLYPLGGLALGALGSLVYTKALSPTPDLSFWLLNALFLFTGLTAGMVLGLRRAIASNEEIGRERQDALDASVVNMSDKYAELQESNRALEEAHQELTRHKEHLEDLVQERTQELEKNKTELEASYEKLQELDRMKMRFFNNVSHELRTPLTLTLSPVEAMLQGEMGPLNPDQKDYLHNVHTNALRLLKLINNLLDLAKLEDGKMDLKYGRYDLPLFIQEVVGSFSVSGEKRGVEIQMKGTGQLPVVYFDKEKVEKVLINLVGNAIKYMSSGGRLEVGWALEEEQVRVSIRDTGPGIPEEALGKIFNRFVQVDDGSSRKAGGTGIGLSLAKEITELHGGEIVAANHPEGGAVFSFTLPLKEQEVLTEDAQDGEKDGWVKSMFQKADYIEEVERTADEPVSRLETRSEAEGEAEDGDERALVLVVEDNPDMRRFTSHSLGKTFRVETAVDGKDGWSKVQARVPDLVVSDIMMPNWNGYQLCAAVKNDPELQHVPLLLLSSKSEVEMKVEGFEQGADDYLTKPYNPRELLARAKSLIRVRKLEKEVRQRNLQLEETLLELRAAQTHLIHSEKMASLGVLSAGLVHEVNNPLNAAISSIRTLTRSLEKIPADERISSTVYEKMNRTSKRALLGLKRCEEIITGLSQFSRKDTEGKKNEDVHEGLDSTLSLIPKELKGETTFHKDYGLKEKVFCHLGQLNQVFMNLLTNACQAVEGKGDVWIRTSEVGDQALITVKDSGCGIPEEQLNRIFEPFYTTKDVGQGTGLGLSISHKIIEEHHGQIDVESTPGNGTQFRISLPLSRHTAAQFEEKQDGSVRNAVGL
jgi:signal transduction histidine kinase